MAESETSGSMLVNLKTGVNELLHSKKFIMGFGSAVAAIVVMVAGHYKIVVDPDLARQIAFIMLGAAGVTVTSQGVADAGKEAAAIKAKTADAPVAVVSVENNNAPEAPK